MTSFVELAGVVFATLLCGAGLLHLIPLLGRPGRALTGALCRAPLVDWVITFFVAAPLIVGPIVDGWAGLAAGLVGQFLALFAWIGLHELMHPTDRRGPRIYKTLDRAVGTTRNHTALWITILGVPALWLIRVHQLVFYPFLVGLLGFPKYKQAEWVNLSRQKFKGLVGYDLVWCLYCDWMTGVWSLGTEMLRNVESFWCPIQFASGKKCDNCKLDFPDVVHGWVPHDRDMTEVAQTVEAMQKSGLHSWFGHPERVGLDVLVPAHANGNGCCATNGATNGHHHSTSRVEALAAEISSLPTEDRERIRELLATAAPATPE
jgi:hypothetical protein